MKRSVLFLLAGLLPAVTASAAADPLRTAATETTARYFETIRSMPQQQELFLRAFPKGADLHNHLVGAIWAEHMIGWAARDSRCVTPATGVISASHCPSSAPASGSTVPAADLLTKPDLYSHEVDALSMRNFVPGVTDHSGHDHFFATFGRFLAATDGHNADMLADALTQAAADHIRYVELMVSPQLFPSAGLAGTATISSPADFPAVSDAITAGLPPLIQAARKETDDMERGARAILKCGQPDAQSGCNVSVRYLYQTLRTLPPAQVFAQLSFGYAVTKADPRFVGVNIVAPEDNPVSMRDYSLHMQMFRFLAQRTPGVKLSLHAGELAPGLVPPEGLRSHIRQAVEIAGASRIGHGVDVVQEENAPQLLNELAARNVMVEINLTSNDEILGISGAAHPFMTYRRYHVPVALSTDDEGVSRGSLTAEYVRAARTWPLTYEDMRGLSRTGPEHAFLPGESLWASVRPWRVVRACEGQSPVQTPVSPACQNFLSGSEKARVQWALEGDFARFEQSVVADRLTRP